MAGSLVVTSMSNPYADDGEQNTIVLDWTSDSSNGDVSSDIASTFATAQALINDAIPQPSKLKGYIVGIETIPGLLGDLATTLPDDLYDITLDDPYDYDLAGASLANRSGTVAQKVVPSAPIPSDSEVTLEVSAAGNSKTGRVILYIAPSL